MICPLGKICNHYQVLEELPTLKQKLKASKTKATEFGKTNSYLSLQNKILEGDISAKAARIKELEEKNRMMQVDCVTDDTNKTVVEAQAAIHKSLSYSLEIALRAANDMTKQVTSERDALKDSQVSSVDLLIKFDEQKEELNNLRKENAETVDYLQTELQNNIDDYNNLVQFAPYPHSEFDAEGVFKWVTDHPEEVDKLQLEWALDNAKPASEVLLLEAFDISQ